MKQLLPIILGSSLVVTACSTTEPQLSTPKTNDTFVARAENPFLTQKQAAYRASRVSNVDYQLNFKLSTEEVFHVNASVSFDLKGVDHPLTIDLDKAEVAKVKINGNEIQPKYNQWFITMDPQYLHNGRNTIEIDYSRKHNTNGEGLHRFKDPVDGKVYLYSHFEPAAAHQMFPSFDQPDLKGTYQLTVSAPKDWYVISTERESQIRDAGDKKIWTFPTTPRLSTYNFSLHAGPYHMWEDDSGKYPARLFARQSVANQISAPMWFKFTKQGFEFFDNYFQIPYPFKKYDQLLVPDFLYGAMENAGAVTFNERRFMTGGSLSKAQQQGLASTILHEMSHQWFGDLVTMKWWNGLWLNESFAAYMHNLSTAEATEFDYTWRSFYSGAKQGAYFQDQLVTTHPIEVPVPSTANAFDNIDSITYAKGASVLRQLTFLLGEEVFRRGIHNYLVKYSYKNATLDDFINSLSESAGRDLSGWTKQWLYQPGVNTITTDYSCENGKIDHFVLKQSAPANHPVLREQRVNIGLFKLGSDGKIEKERAVPVTYEGASTQIDSLVGAQCPDLVYPNYQDWGFVKVNLDRKSFDTVKSSINGVDDPLLRSMLWQALSDSVNDGTLPLNEYIDVLLANAASEKDYTIVRQLNGGFRRAWSYLEQFGTRKADYREQQTQKLEALAWQAIQDNKANPNMLRIWFGLYATNATSDESLKKLEDILNGKVKIDNLDLHQNLRWNLIQSLNRRNYAKGLELIGNELKRDKSDNGAKQAIAARAERPDPEQKRYWLEQMAMDNSEYPFAKLRSAMGSLFPNNQTELHEQYAEYILSNLQQLDKKKEPLFMRSYGRLIPSTCTQANQQRLDKAVKEMTDLSNGTERALRLAQYFNQHCLKVLDNMTR